MPVAMHKRKSKKPFKIVENSTGDVIGSSTTQKKARASVRARNAGRHGWKATRRRKR